MVGRIQKRKNKFFYIDSIIFVTCLRFVIVVFPDHTHLLFLKVNLLVIVETTNIRLYSHKENRLQNVYGIGRGKRSNSIIKWQIITNIKLKLSCL